MAVQVVCPSCRTRLSLGDDPAGRTVRCPKCGSSFRPTLADDGSRCSTLGPPPAAPANKADRPTVATEPPGAAPAPPPSPAAMIGPFEVCRELGRGAFGVVYQAHDPALKRELAIKVLNRDALSSEKAVERFLREARVVAQMHHNNIVPVYQLGEHAGAHFIASKFIAGQVLSEAIPENGMEPARAVDLVIQLLEALAYAHDMGVLHRDVKPSNAVLDPKGQLFLMDFGLAGWVGQETGRMTQDGSVMGTPAYMAPEQARGDIRNVGCAADQYSAGVVLYELLTGHLPFEGAPVQVIVYHVINSPTPRPSEWRADLDPGLEEICLRATAKEPGQRYPGCRDFADALRGWRAGNGGVPTAPHATAVRPPQAVAPLTVTAVKQHTLAPPPQQTAAVQISEDTGEPAAGFSRRAWFLIVGGAIALPALTGGAVIIKLLSKKSKQDPENQGPGFRRLRNE